MVVRRLRRTEDDMRALILLTVMVLASTVGCANAPAPVVISQAAGNPLAGVKKFGIGPVTYDSPLKVGAKFEAEYLAGKSPEDIRIWNEAKNAFGAAFTATLSSNGLLDSAARYTVRPRVTFIEPGYNVNLWYRLAEVDVDVWIVDAQGHEIDHIATRAQAVPPFAIPERLSRCGQRAAAMVGDYLRKRTQAP